ncbi:MAG TPA: hypothetical protein VG943_14545 [Caulobacterales bacterium]|nr:hypothetical protein [Caulobacterales bacterium]
MATLSRSPKAEHVSVVHAAAIGAAIVMFLLVVLWASAALGMLPHLRSLFGPMGAGSPFAIVVALAFALVLGAAVGAVFGVGYNIARRAR